MHLSVLNFLVTRILIFLIKNFTYLIFRDKKSCSFRKSSRRYNRITGKKYKSETIKVKKT